MDGMDGLFMRSKLKGSLQRKDHHTLHKVLPLVAEPTCQGTEHERNAPPKNVLTCYSAIECDVNGGVGRRAWT